MQSFGEKLRTMWLLGRSRAAKKKIRAGLESGDIAIGDVVAFPVLGQDIELRIRSSISSVSGLVLVEDKNESPYALDLNT